MPPRTRKARSYDPGKTRAAVSAQFGHVRDVVRRLGAERFAVSTRLGDWTVRELLAHISMAVESVNRALEQPAPPTPQLAVADWALATAALADEIGEDTRALAASADPAELLERAAARFAELVPAAADDRPVAARVGAMRLDDYLVTRCVELVVHTDDLADALGIEIPYDRQALAITTRLLADAFAEKAPGNAVELRVPPYAAVQCVAGPRHTRGTPPNVVETAPLTWIRLATGRTAWADAVDSAQVSASGERADLSGHLPVLG
ncbi:sterol carrier family protein [Streptomyces sp. NPDC020096]